MQVTKSKHAASQIGVNIKLTIGAKTGLIQYALFGLLHNERFEPSVVNQGTTSCRIPILEQQKNMFDQMFIVLTLAMLWSYRYRIQEIGVVVESFEVSR